MNYIETIKKRRSIYKLSSSLNCSKEEIRQLVNEIVVESPTAFNMQSSKVILIFGNEHKMVWDITRNILKARIPDDKFGSTQSKMEMFKNAAGTILFFEDDNIVNHYKSQFPTYAASFDMFAEHGLGILQGNVWNALAEKGIGANLQHYNPLIDDEVKKEWNVPNGWRLVSQMVFGKIEEVPEPKEKFPASERVLVFGIEE